MSDTGPPYPPAPKAGSNAIGSFIIGVSQIGTIQAFDYWRTIISQYANSPRLVALIESFNSAADLTALFDEFFDKIWNVDTAEGYGLDVWGRRVGVDRVLPIVQNVKSFGFAEGGSQDYTTFNTLFYAPDAFLGFAESGDGRSFGEAGFYDLPAGPIVVGVHDAGSFYPGDTITENYRLDDDVFRRLILAKAMANISDGSIPAINDILMSMFPGRGNCYVKEGSGIPDAFGFAESGTAEGFNQLPFLIERNLPYVTFLGFAEADSWQPFNQAAFYTVLPSNRMNIAYVFEFPLQPVDVSIIEQSGVIPKPPGVTVEIVQRY